MRDFDENSTYAKYGSVSIGDETSKYRISISGYKGDSGTYMVLEKIT
jgi:hypothetical protein